jgi:hypothetical protein
MAPKRSKRKSRSKVRHLICISVIEIIGYAALTARYGTGVYGIGLFVLLSVVGITLWLLFLIPTKCDFEVRGRGCRRNVYGKAIGCQDHGQAKRDAMFAALKMRNPGMAFRVTWLDGAHGGRPLGHSTPADVDTSRVPNRGQALFNLASIFVATVGSVAGVLALFVGN